MLQGFGFAHIVILVAILVIQHIVLAGVGLFKVAVKHFAAAAGHRRSGRHGIDNSNGRLPENVVAAAVANAAAGVGGQVAGRQMSRRRHTGRRKVVAIAFRSPAILLLLLLRVFGRADAVSGR